MDESKRVRSFRLSLAKQIPKFPNNKATLTLLQQKPLSSLLIDYANWRIRYIVPRPRQVIVETTASNDPRWKTYHSDIQSVLQRVTTGDDLTPYLSLQPHTRGFTPAASSPGADVDRWADKDMLLNVMGFHHLHMDAAPSKHMRSDDVLFVRVDRSMFAVAGIFDHTVFNVTKTNSSMAAERERLFDVFNELTMRGHPPGSVVVLPPIAMSGHPLYIIRLAGRYDEEVRKTDPLLENCTYAESLYHNAGLPLPKKIKLKWHLHYLDLGLLDEGNNNFFVLQHGPN